MFPWPASPHEWDRVKGRTEINMRTTTTYKHQDYGMIYQLHLIEELSSIVASFLSSARFHLLVIHSPPLSSFPKLAM